MKNRILKIQAGYPNIIVLFIAIALATLFSPVILKTSAQTSREVLTNAKILDLVHMGLGEALIVAKINQSECQCDTSTAAIGKLKLAKVSDAIIMAMLNAAAGSADTIMAERGRTTTDAPRQKQAENAKVEPPTADPQALNQITEPGIYLFEDEKMTVIEPSVFSSTKISVWKSALTYGIKKSKWRAKMRGKMANLKTQSSQPVFYFVFNPEYKNSGAVMAGGLWWGMPASSPAEFMMVQVKVKDASREAVLGEYSLMGGASWGARDEDIREYAFEKIRPGIYKVVPKQPLARGEYCFYYASVVASLGFAGGKVFDFSVIGRN